MARSIGGLTGIPLLPSRVSDSVERSVRDVKVSGLDQTNYDGTARFERKTVRMFRWYSSTSNPRPDRMAIVSRAKQFGRDLTARAIAPVLRRLAHDPKYFELWQRHGFHITGVDYYQPIPDTRALPLSLWDRISDLPGIDMREEQQKQLLSEIVARFKDEFTAIPEGASTQEFHYYRGKRCFRGGGRRNAVRTNSSIEATAHVRSRVRFLDTPCC